VAVGISLLLLVRFVRGGGGERREVPDGPKGDLDKRVD
jgi:hypothetical protein